jgi:ATP-dependent Clp protease ATP-binding subunit ClpB
MPGEFEERLSIVVSEVVEASQKGPCIMFIDDIHNLCPPPPSGNNGAAILKPALGEAQPIFLYAHGVGDEPVTILA